MPESPIRFHEKSPILPLNGFDLIRIVLGGFFELPDSGRSQYCDQMLLETSIQEKNSKSVGGQFFGLGVIPLDQCFSKTN